MIDVLNNWIGSSIVNFNIFVGVTTVVAFASIIVMLYFGYKLGKPDERTSIIYLKISSTMFSTIFLLLAIYSSWGDGLYFRQYISLIMAITVFVGAILTIHQYRKDFN